MIALWCKQPFLQKLAAARNAVKRAFGMKCVLQQMLIFLKCCISTRKCFLTSSKALAGMLLELTFK